MANDPRSPQPTPVSSPAGGGRTLAIDVGGSNVKMLLAGHDERLTFPSGPQFTPSEMTRRILETTSDWQYDQISLGVPTPVVQGRPIREPANLGSGWLDFDFQTALQRPTKVINDAAMQAIGNYDGGRMLFLGLGTGLGSAMIVDHVVAPLELAELPYHYGKTMEESVCRAALEEIGKKRWRVIVRDIVEILHHCLCVEYITIGGGNAKKLAEVPEYARVCPNANAFIGGFRLWDQCYDFKIR